MTEIIRKLRVAAYAVIVDDGRILLSRWLGPERPRWILPGGGVDHGEDPYDAVVREVFEETGYRAEVQRLLGIQSVHGPLNKDGVDVDYHRIRILYEAKVVGGELTYEVGGTTDQAAWFPLSEVPDLDHVESVDVGLEMYRNHPPDGRIPRFT
ncbi:NUDIX hydrolase [Saccharothrix algeriensis]|uniref:ADP-ribose pyrophosphatase YjhB (NUDIX family) n=1 Tax=Saccharothrix algeriensis TaxID=173560 RepID=A0A8T8I4R8_9PSEU|nr:NUDIX hydrolase [Saccharothrix algeriensis]MBM7812184.1 ADP-ribose pyrophosphatase YjhB (NUDIX family) [Saccharothrix algeriensis]QTR05822.1 NUDIX hydrolase [Saccharothrix algeriensis]